eukprot:CAMPEP_0175080622 /NCGR_PEP_ID=MMETSP0052_2-20121109/25621_1 /TAXON_ID=51329 ORGANISM="Polytomella parva, Strain SAG 63-3" /NCGR_SAMPLE_ID=MMETSP0052_2 /ASSEMBLY_ACC=CAM_ASM_000194 /LENGTH=563 /DNA_ID=CAMNT_0016351365 /DNA_START=76 /DNA_END=1768 /DNA_ORIENTATION=+
MFCKPKANFYKYHANINSSSPASNSKLTFPPSTAEAIPPVIHTVAGNLVNWIEKEGGSVLSVYVSAETCTDSGQPCGWGLRSARDLSPGQQLIRLPLSCQLTYFDADEQMAPEEEDTRLLRLIKAVPEELWIAKLALKLLNQRSMGSESRYDTYIKNLPATFPGIPTFFGKDAIDAIDYPPVVRQIQKRGSWMFKFSRDVLARLPGTSLDVFGGTLVDINALGWACAAVSSRAFRTRGPSRPAAMLPLVDMANHSAFPNCEVRPLADSNGGIALVAKTSIPKDTPLTLSYGSNLGSDFLFLDYGFLDRPCPQPHEAVSLRFDPGLLQAGAFLSGAQGPSGKPVDPTLEDWRLERLRSLGLVDTGADVEVTVRREGRSEVDGQGGLRANRHGGIDSDSNDQDRDISNSNELSDSEFKVLIDERLMAAARIMMAACESDLEGDSSSSPALSPLVPSSPPALTPPLPASSFATSAPSRQGGGLLWLDLATCRCVAGLLAIALSNFKTTLEEDTSKLQEAGVDPNLKLAIQFRMGKKRILKAAIRQVREVENLVITQMALTQNGGEE